MKVLFPHLEKALSEHVMYITEILLSKSRKL